MARSSSLAHRGDLFKAADEAIAVAFSGAVTIDRLLRRELSEVMARVQSVVTRHGGLLQSTVVGTLMDTGRYEVLTRPAIGITAAADALVAAKVLIGAGVVPVRRGC